MSKRAVLLASTALALAAPFALPAGAQSRVGVTSATDGDPLGKPPQAAERVLRIGIDVQANEVIRTGTTDRAHLVFLDGTALTVGPNALLTIDKFVYDPNTKVGELAINASQGVLRLVGGKISKTNPITVTTPSSTIGIRGGIATFEVTQRRTVSTFLFGNHMTVFGGGLQQNVTRPGSQVTTNQGSPPSPPVMVGTGALSGQFAQLEGTNNSGGNGGGGNNSGGGNNPGPGGSGGNTAGNGGNAERGAQNFGRSNGPSAPGTPPGGTGGPLPGALNPANNPLANNPGANPNANPANINPTTTTVIVSQQTISTNGRYLADPTYTNFNASDLSATANANNNRTITGSSTVTKSRTTTTNSNGSSSSTSTSITLNVPNLGSITLPWVQDTLSNGFSVGTMNALGQTLTNGTGYVSPKGEFFAYIFTVNGNKVGIFGGTPTAATGTTNFPTSGVAAFSISAIGDNGKIPFAVGTIKNDSNLTNAAVVSNLYTAYSTTLTQTVGQAPPDARATALQSTISIAGTGSSQKSYMGVFIGTFYRDITTTGGTVTTDNGMALSGNYNGTYRTSATGAVGISTSAESTPLTGNGNAIYGTPSGDGAAAGIILTPDKLTSVATTNTGGLVTDVTSTRTTQASLDSPAALGGSNSGYYTVTAASATTTPSGVGVNRTTQTLNGFVGGIVDQTNSSNVTSSRIIGTSDPTTLSLTTSATNNRASANISVANFSGANTAEFKLGGTTAGDGATSAFVDNNTYALRDRTSDIGTTTTIGGSSTNVTSTTTMVSAGAAKVSGYNLCSECTFLTYGWWGGNISYTNASAVNPGGVDRLNFATYVAGTLAVASDVNSSQSTGTYSGNMIGNVNNNGTSYVSSGTYQNVWSFGSRSGVVTATFDGTTYGGGNTANTYLTSNSAVTFGTLSGVAGTSTPIVSGGKSLTLNGAFFSGGSGNVVAGQAGSFGITGTNYQAAGTFAGKKQ